MSEEEERPLFRRDDPPSSEEALRHAEIAKHRKIARAIVARIPHPFTAREVRTYASEMGHNGEVSESIRRRVHEDYEDGLLVSVGRDWKRGGMLLTYPPSEDAVVVALPLHPKSKYPPRKAKSKRPWLQ